jgi:class 3 adenylate cyclase
LKFLIFSFVLFLVIAFAGDALICVFQDMPDSDWSTDDKILKQNCCYRALQCASILRTYHTKQLSSHLGVSYGEMKLALLGGLNDQWVYLLNGECVSELADCINSAGPKEVVATKQCYVYATQAVAELKEYLEEFPRAPAAPAGLMGRSAGGFLHVPSADANSTKSVEGDPSLSKIFITVKPCKDSDNVLIDMIETVSPAEGAEVSKQQARKMSSVLLKKQVTSRVLDFNLIQVKQQELLKAAALFIPRPVLAAVNSESLEHIGELRQVTTMFLSLDSYSSTKHRDPVSLQSFFLMAQKVLFESGGFLRQFLVDDKGCVFIAMWGMPSFTYANNCSRALFCGVSIAMQASSLDHFCSIGITTGNIFCGSVGAPERRDYAGIGNEVNLAARLMSKAHGRVLIDKNTYTNLNQATRALLIAAEEMKLKGMENPVVPYQYNSDVIPRVAALDESPGFSTILRKQVKAILSAQMDKITNGSDSMTTAAAATDLKNVYFTIILGMPGTGKSTAAEYFRHGLRKRNIPCILIQARPGHEGVPYGLMRELFLELVGEDNFLTETQQKKKIKYLIDQAYPSATEDEKRRSRNSLQLLLGVEWTVNDISQLSVSNTPLENSGQGAGFHDSTSDKSNPLIEDTSPRSPIKVASPRGETASKNPSNPTAAPLHVGSEKDNIGNMLENYEASMCRPVGDMTFYKILSVLLRNQRSAIIIEDAHFCDELSWNELHLLLIGNELNLVVLLTMRSNTAAKPNPAIDNNASMMPMSEGIDKSFNGRRGSVLSRAAEAGIANPVLGGDTDGTTRFGFKSQTSAAYLSILGHENSTVVEMNSLTESEVKEILLHTLKVETISVDLVKLVLDVSSGNAFWCKAIANFINERGVKELEKATEGETRQNSLKQLIVLRMEKLSMDVQLVLKHASILGDEFSENMLEAVIPEKLKPGLAETLDSLVEHGFILCIEEFPQMIFGFQNQLIRSTVYELTPPRFVLIFFSLIFNSINHFLLFFSFLSICVEMQLTLT